MLELIQDNIQLISICSVILFSVLLLICIIGRFFRVAIGLVILSVLIPILFTVFWGDGREYVHEFTSVFAEPHKQNIEEFYDAFKEREQSSPVIDYEAVSEKATHVFEAVTQEASNLLENGGSE